MTKITGNQIIMIGDELHSPAIEHEIIKHGRSLIEDGNSPVIPCPRIVRIHLTENDTVVINLTQLFTYGGLVRTDNQELLMFDHLLGNRYKTRNHLV